MNAPIVHFKLTATELGPRGADRIELLFASDKNLTPGPVAKVASGGELSRLTLALRLATGIGDAALIAFDEVDAGIGGATARAMGEKLATLSRQADLLRDPPAPGSSACRHTFCGRPGRGEERRYARTGDERLPSYRECWAVCPIVSAASSMRQKWLAPPRSKPNRAKWVRAI